MRSSLLRFCVRYFMGSPLHDGAVVIRDGRVAAARSYALSDNYHLRRDFGEASRGRRRERNGRRYRRRRIGGEGTISIAIDGVLHVLGNADSLRTHLHRLLGLVVDDERRPIVGMVQETFPLRERSRTGARCEEQHAVAAELETNYDEQVNDSHRLKKI